LADTNRKIDKLEARLKVLETDFSPWKTLYKDIRDNLVPFEGWFPEDHDSSYNITANDKRMNIDVTRAARIFGAGLYQGLCQPSQQWFKIGLEDQDLDNYGPVKDWLHYVEKLYINTFYRSNFYNVQQRVMKDQGWGGTAAYIPERLPGPPWMYFHYFPIGSYRLALGERGRHDTIYRPIKMTAHQIATSFGKDKISGPIKRALDKNPDEKFEVVHAIEPRDQDDREYGRIDNLNMPFKSCWFEKNKKVYLRESGFTTFPAVVPRYMEVGDFPYGAGPGIDAIKQIKLAHRMEKDGLKGFHREVMPPLAIPSRFEGIIDLTPDGLNFGLDGDKGSIGPIIQTNINWQHFQARLDNISRSVDRAFFVDLFLMILNSNSESPRDTATAVLKKYEEKITVLGPAIENQNTQNLDVCFDLMFGIFLQTPGLIPPPPPEIQGKNLKIKYTSILAQAQQMTEVSKIHTYLDVADRVAQIDQQSIIATDSYQILKEAEQAIGIAPKILRTEEEYQGIIEAQRKAQAQAQQAEQLKTMAGAAKDIGSANVDGTLLGELKEAGGGA
jgi:hypothetical protein